MYQKCVGRIILYKNTILRIILNRVAKTNNYYKTFPMDILDGRIGLRLRVQRQ